MRPLPQLPPPHEVHLWQIPHDQLLLPEPPLSNSEVERAQSYRFEADQRRYLVTQTRKREILGGYLSTAPAELVFTQNESGRPELDGLQFSISHSSDYSVLAVAQDAPLGLDLEKVSPRSDHFELARHILTDSEFQFFTKSPPSEQLGLFYHFWTAKESYLKALGTGLQIEPSLVETDPPKMMHAKTAGHPSLQLAALRPTPNHLLHLATRDEVHLLEWQSF